MPEVESLLTETDAAGVLKVAIPTLRNWRAAGRGPSFIKIGNCVRYSPADLRSYIEARTRRPVADRKAA